MVKAINPYAKGPCARCGKDPAEGFAMINDEYFCHGDFPGTTCYELAQWALSTKRMQEWIQENYEQGRIEQ